MLYGTLWMVAVGSGYAQDAPLPEDLTTLGPEELLALELIPIDVLGAHIHPKGVWMAGYRFGSMHMKPAHGLHDRAYALEPKAMHTGMHMVEAMYGITDRLTLAAMLSYQRSILRLQTTEGMRYRITASGLGDVQIALHYALRASMVHYLTSFAGLSLPVGRVNLWSDRLPRPLPYAMRPGSGTWDMLIGLASIHRLKDWNLGVHGDALWRIGKNTYGYRLGHRIHAGAWATYRLWSWLAFTMHVDGHLLGDVSGRDARLDPHVSPMDDPALQGDRHVMVQPSINIYLPKGPLRGMRWALHLDLPLKVWHETAAMEMHRQWILALQWAW